MNKNGNDHDLIGHKFYHAGQECSLYDEEAPCTPQTEHPTYRLAYLDSDFMLRDELRPVRFQLELLKPEMLLEEAGVQPFGTATTNGGSVLHRPKRAIGVGAASAMWPMPG